MKTNLMQLLRLVLMVLAVAGVIYAIEFMERGIAVWFWVALLGIGFAGLLYTFRLTQRRVAREQRERQRLEKQAADLNVPLAQRVAAKNKLFSIQKED